MKEPTTHEENLYDSLKEQPPQDWEERFAKLWETDSQIYGVIVDFIRNLLSQRDKELIEKLPEADVRIKGERLWCIKCGKNYKKAFKDAYKFKGNQFKNYVSTFQMPKM